MPDHDVVDDTTLQDRILELREAVRASTPLVQCITNTVVQQFTANVLLAIGGAPAMLDHEADAGQFAEVASGVLVNFGTATSHQFLAADAAIEAARATNTPWVLDPVSVGGLAYRTTRIRRVAAESPTVVRGNASEVAALAGIGLGGRGVDSTDAVDDVLHGALSLARDTGAVVAISGETDAIVGTVDGEHRLVRITGGDTLMPLVIGTGCSLGAVVAAYVAAAGRTGEAAADAQAAFEATIAAHAHFAAAGIAARRVASAPGSFAVAFLDALYSVGPEDFAAVGLTVEVLDPETAGSPA